MPFYMIIVALVTFSIERSRLLHFPSAAYNDASNRLCEKIGLVREGRLRNTVYTDGLFYDEIRYGLTIDEYHNLTK